MKTLRILAAVLALGCSAARAEAILDLSASQQGPTSSLLDLGAGTEAPWGSFEIEVRGASVAAGASASGTSDDAGRKPEVGGPNARAARR